MTTFHDLTPGRHAADTPTVRLPRVRGPIALPEWMLAGGGAGLAVAVLLAAVLAGGAGMLAVAVVAPIGAWL